MIGDILNDDNWYWNDDDMMFLVWNDCNDNVLDDIKWCSHWNKWLWIEGTVFKLKPSKSSSECSDSNAVSNWLEILP